MSPVVHAMAIADVRDGMVLAEALHDQSGSVLLPAGATLTSGTLNALRRRGVESLGGLGDDAPDDGAAAAERERQCARLARLFRHSAGLGASGELLQRLYLYRQKA